LRTGRRGAEESVVDAFLRRQPGERRPLQLLLVLRHSLGVGGHGEALASHGS